MAKDSKILVVIKKPGEAPYVEPQFDNTLEAFQKAVGGYIETVTFSSDACFICNEEGRLKGLPYNFSNLGCDFVGTVLGVGVKGDEFASLKASFVPHMLKIMGGAK